jgi:N-acetylmuramoyl-L-alanine amidase
MAKWQLPFIVGAFLAQISLVGCTDNRPAVSSLPPPSFDAPRMMAVAPTPPPFSSAPMASSLPNSKRSYLPPPRYASAAGIPMGWVPPVAPRAWRWIVIHHSATTTGGAAAFDKMHRAKGWDELGYDFVIGNGTDTHDGLIEVGPRWTKQKIGAHAKTPDNRFNEYGIGICLVGNFDVERPTPAQIRSLTKLVAYLMKTYQISPDRVLGHRDTKPTECPGQYMNVALIRHQAAQLADMGALQDRAEASAPRELLNNR